MRRADAEPREGAVPGEMSGRRHAPAAPCLNCGATGLVHEGQPAAFCPQCGQSTRTARLRLRDLGSALSRHVLQFDRGFLHTLTALLRSPGGVVREYLAGRRKSYLNPWAYLLIGAAISVLVYNLFGGAQSEQIQVAIEASADQRTDLTSEQRQRLAAARVALTQQMTIASVVLGLPLALLLRLAFWRTLNLAEAAVYALYLIGHVFFLDLVTYVLLPLHNGLVLHLMATQLVYLGTAIWFGATFSERRWLGAVQSVVAMVLSMVLASWLTGIAMDVWVRMG